MATPTHERLDVLGLVVELVDSDLRCNVLRDDILVAKGIRWAGSILVFIGLLSDGVFIFLVWWDNGNALAVLADITLGHVAGGMPLIVLSTDSDVVSHIISVGGTLAPLSIVGVG